MYEIKQRLWFNHDKTAVVADGDPQAAFLYSTEGHFVPDSEAAQFGLDDIQPYVEPDSGSEPSAVEPDSGSEPSTKASRPTANKALKPAENKGE